MSFYHYEPFYEIERLSDALFPSQGNKHVHNALCSHGAEGGVIRSFKPRMDLHEDVEKNVVTAVFEFPGVSKEDIQIDLHGGKLTVSAETKQSEEHNESGYAVRERRYGKYSRTLQLPQGVKDEEIKAVMENGVLTITFPKSGQEVTPKRIVIA
jgi:HSP20 family protein